MRTTINLLGVIMSALSILLLIQHGFKVGFVETLKSIFEYYEYWIWVLFGWIDPYIKKLLIILNNYLQFDLTLYPHWRHLYVLTSIYVGRDVFRTISIGNVWSGMLYFIFGLVFVTIISIGAGTIPLVSDQNSNDFLIVLYPIFGIWGYRLCVSAWGSIWFRTETARFADNPNISWWGSFISLQGTATIRSIVAIIVLLISLNTPLIQNLMSPSLAILGILFILLALHSLWGGYQDGKFLKEQKVPKFENQPLFTVMKNTGNWNMGWGMLQIAVGVLVVLLCNAGFRLLGAS